MKHLLITLLLVPFVSIAQILPPPPPPPQPPKKSAEENLIYDFVDKEAEYPGGVEALMEDLKKSIEYPDSAKEAGIEGKVYIEFVVEKNGEVSQVKLLRGIGYGCDEAAVKAVKALKPWIPAEQNGKLVRQKMRLPVVFRLEGR